MATRGIAALGQDAIGPVAAKVTDPRVLTRDAAVSVFAEMLDPEVVKLDADATQRVKTILLSALRDPEFQIRIMAIGGLARLKTPDVTAALQAIAASDPFHRPSMHGGQVSYPVREAAVAALRIRGK